MEAINNAVLIGDARLARLPLSDMAARLYNDEGSISPEDILNFACSFGDDSKEPLLCQSRVIIWNAGGRKGAYGMSMSDEDIMSDMESQGIEVPADIHIDEYSSENLTLRNVSVKELLDCMGRQGK